MYFIRGFAYLLYVVCIFFCILISSYIKKRFFNKKGIQHNSKSQLFISAIFVFLSFLFQPIPDALFYELNQYIYKNTLLEKNNIIAGIEAPLILLSSFKKSDYSIDSNLDNIKEYHSNHSENQNYINFKDNRITTIESTPLEERVLIPEWSMFPNVNMEAIDIYNIEKAKKNSEEVSSPFFAKHSEKEKLLEELKIEILKNPLVGDMVVQGLLKSNIKNTSLKRFAKMMKKSFKLPNDDKKRGISKLYSAYTFSDKKYGIFVTDEYRKYAEEICKELDLFIIYGTGSFVPKYYYGLNLSVTYQFVRTEKKDWDSNKKIKCLILFRKVNNKMTSVIGFDLSDKGMLIFESVSQF